MDNKAIAAWAESKDEIKAALKKARPNGYEAILKIILEHISEDDYGWGTFNPNPDGIIRHDFGDYQGTLLFVIPEIGGSPSRFWTTQVSYGSCSGCDTLEGLIEKYDRAGRPIYNIDGLMTLALHLVQRLNPTQVES